VARINHFGRELAKLLPTDKRVFFSDSQCIFDATAYDCGFQRYVSVHPFKQFRVLFFRICPFGPWCVHGTETATTLRNSSAGTDYGNGYENGYWWT